jgi:hypothetical protein
VPLPSPFSPFVLFIRIVTNKGRGGDPTGIANQQFFISCRALGHLKLCPKQLGDLAGFFSTHTSPVHHYHHHQRRIVVNTIYVVHIL